MNKTVKMIAFILMSFALSNKVNATYVDVQSGSLMGMVHASVADRFFEHHHLSAGLGYVPKLDHHREMSMVSLRYRYQHPSQFTFQLAERDWSLSLVNFGIAALVGSHRDLFISLPEKYPDDYYPPTALRLIFNYQSILKLSEKTEVYFDVSMLDVGFISYIREPDFFYGNYEFLGLAGVTNWGFGVRHQF